MRFAPQTWAPSLSPTLVNWLRPFRERKRQSEVNIGEIDIRGDKIVRDQLDQGCGVLVMPNHASHADPYVIYAGADKVGTALHVMATWHVFHDQPRLIQWALRKHGCFSVDREANAIGAFRIATKILQEKREPLVLFPEGEIYHCNDRVTPFREGAAAIAVTAARKAKRPIVCVPCAMTYRYAEDPTEAMLETMGELEEAIFWRRRIDRPLDERIYGFAEALLVVKELEYYGETRSGRLPNRIRALEDHILQQVESRHEISGAGKSLPERVKAARKTIIEKISDDQISKSDKQALDHDLEDLFIVVQSFSYPGDYVNDKPTIERMAETLDKFEEDVLQKVTASIKGERRAIVQFGEPLQVVGDRKVKNQTTDITSTIEQRVQAMLDEVA
ncbi:MAG: 1-acyl-sn-glycerol-3-phosphate acyltransferase [Pirellulaceae bacterium]|nr:1-acyl-sn-glycerol-3-phosphate acyltransferase [Pirellulaceae bacterium]